MEKPEIDEKTLILAGFVKNTSGHFVKGHCEVHVTRTSGGIELKIPVIRTESGEPVRDRLLTYLRDRNRTPKGPGTFAIQNGIVWCVAALDDSGDLAGTASDLAAQVERLGPKILNLK